MEDSGESAHHGAVALRLIFGSLIATAGLLLLGVALSSPSASAAEPTPNNPSFLGGVSSAVTSLDGTLSSAVGQTVSVTAVVAPVTAALPAPVKTVLNSVAPAVESAASATGSGIVSQVVSPVAGTVDDALGLIPGANNLLGNTPLGSIANPTTSLVDGAVGTVAGVIDPATAVGNPSGSEGPTIGGTVPGSSQYPGTPGGELSGPAFPAELAMSTGIAHVTTQNFVSDAATASFASRVAGVTTSGSPTAPSGEPVSPFGSPLAVAPPGTGGASSGPGSGPGGAASSADIASAVYISGPAAGSGGSSENDALPSSPAADHDSSPD